MTDRLRRGRGICRRSNQRFDQTLARYPEISAALEEDFFAESASFPK